MYDEFRRVGRKKQFAQRITLSLPAGTTAQIDALREPKEARLDFIREAIAREIRRRMLHKAPPKE